MSQSPSLGLMVMWFVIVLALIPISLWVLKRSGVAGAVSRAEGCAMRTVGQHVLGQGQRLVTVEVGQGDQRTWLVLGVTPHSIQTVHTMAPQGSAPQDAAVPAPAFAQLLGQWAQRGKQPGQGGA